MLPITRWQQRCTGWMEPSKQALKSGILACTLLTSPAFALSVDDAKHLALRTSFAANPSLMNALLPLSREEAVDYVLNQVEPHPVEPPDFLFNREPPVDRSNFSAEDKELYNQQKSDQIYKLRMYWIEDMIKTKNPFVEEMVIFWSNHFTTSLEKPNDPIIAFQKKSILDYHALGRYDWLLKSIMQDPAILIYLDNYKNTKSSPNENLARELLELYTLGEGNYSEIDVKEVSRALTGWGVIWKERAFKFRVDQHDSSEKNILGEKGNYNMPDILDLLLDKQSSGELIVRKLWMQFISPTPDENFIKEVATSFISQDYDIKKLMRIILLSEEFWDTRNRSTLVKSPIEMIIGLYRQFEVNNAPNKIIVDLTKDLGQSLFSPPNVKGWPIASSDWINSETLLKRQNAINRLMRAKESDPNMTDEEAVLNEAMQQWANSEAFHYQKDWLLAAPPVGDVESDDPMETLKNILSDPVYQLK
jgi:uncharacterized protein (DUF1800 family)